MYDRAPAGLKQEFYDHWDQISKMQKQMLVLDKMMRDYYLTDAEVEAWWEAHSWAVERGYLPK